MNTDTDRLNWLESKGALINMLTPENSSRMAISAAHICISGVDPYGFDSKHYYGPDYRAVIDKAMADQT